MLVLYYQAQEANTLSSLHSCAIEGKETAFNMVPGAGTPSVRRLRKEPKGQAKLIFSILEGTGSVQVCFSPAKEAPYGTVWQTIQAGSPLKTTYGEMGSKGRYLLVRVKEGKVGMVRVRVGRNN